MIINVGSMGLGIVERAGKGDAAPKENKVFDTVSTWFDGKKLVQPTDYSRLVKAFKSWVYVCASKNSTSFAAVPLKLYVTKQSPKQKVFIHTKQVDRDVRKYMEKNADIMNLPCVRKAAEILEIPDHPLLDVIQKVNPFMNRFDLFELTNLFLELAGNAYWYIAKNRLGVPVEIWTLTPSRMTIVPSKTDWISGYLYTTADGKDVPFGTDEIIHFKFPNPTNDYYGWAPLQAMADAYNTNESYSQYEQHLIRNNAVPPIALIAPKESVITQEQWKTTMTRWNATYGGPYNAGKAAWLESGFDVKTLAPTPKEMAFATGRKWMMQEICAAYGVPMSKVTVENVNRANADSGESQYLSDTIRPRCVRFESRINETLALMVDENIFFMFDNPVPEDGQFALKERTAHLSAYITTVNEERMKLGLDPVEWGDKPLAPATVATLTYGDKPAAPAVPAVGPVPADAAAKDQAAKDQAAKDEQAALDKKKQEGKKKGEDDDEMHHMIVGYLAKVVSEELRRVA
jgi:HK97 family phage portal protein